MKYTKDELQDVLRNAPPVNGKRIPISGNKSELCDRILQNGLEHLLPGKNGPAASPKASLPRARSPPRAPVALPGPRATMQQEFDRCMQMKYDQIQDEARKYGIKLTGTKEVLCQRLAEYLTIGQARKQQGPISAAEPLPVAPQPGLLKPKIFTMAECGNWTVKQLQARLKELGLPTSGLKQELCERLAEYEKSQLPSTKHVHNIVFMEPFGLKTSALRRVRPIGITGRMYNAILAGPIPYTTHRGKKCTGNSYVFGPLLDLDSYTLVGKHGNASFSTGFIDYDLAIKSPDPKEEVWKQIYPIIEDDPAKLRKLQSDLPYVLWIGRTIRGNVGASLYAHYDKNGEIDSIIVNDNCLFEV